MVVEHFPPLLLFDGDLLLDKCLLCICFREVDMLRTPS